MHINDYFYHMFPGARGHVEPPIRHGKEAPSDDYNDWTLETECGICSTEVCIAATRFMDTLDSIVPRIGIYEAVREQIQIICYG